MKRSDMRRKTQMRKQSKKRQKAARVRQTMLKEFYENVCEGAALVPHVKCYGPLDPHEPLTRARGGSITDPENLMWLCRGHHDWAHLHQIEAEKVGLLLHSWSSR